MGRRRSRHTTQEKEEETAGTASGSQPAPAPISAAGHAQQVETIYQRTGSIALRALPRDELSGTVVTAGTAIAQSSIASGNDTSTGEAFTTETP